jgi:adenosine kinase
MQILLTGSLSVDQIMNFDGSFESMIRPEKLHVLSLSVLIKELHKTQGGIAGNIAYSLALLGEKPILLAAIGEDQRAYMQSLQTMGVETSHVHYSKLPTATFNVITDKNDCQVGGFYPGAMSDASSLALKPFATQDVLVVISAHDPAQMAVQIAECQSLKKRLCFDIGQQVTILPTEVLEQGLATAELLILNDYELGMLAERLKKTQTEVIQSVPVCIVTLGEKGAEIHSEKNHWQPEKISAITVEQAVDPTGAGDAFRAGFLYGYVREWSLANCVQLGATVAAYTVEKYGTQTHTFTLSELAERYQQHYQTKLVL